MPRRVLVTGGAGFIGSALLRLLDADDEVVVLDNFHPQVHKSREWTPPGPASVRVLVGDVTDPVAVAAAVAFEPTAVVHLAAETGTGQSLRESSRHAGVNVLGTAVLLDALSSATLPERVVLASSRAVYGEGAWISSGGERIYGVTRSAAQLERHEWEVVDASGRRGESPVGHSADAVEARPTNVYAATKLAQENVLTAWCEGLGVGYGILRLQNVYGAGQAVQNSYTGVLTYFARQATLGQQIEVFEGGGIVRDFVHVTDVARAILSAIDLKSPLNSTVDIGSGRPVTLLEVACELAALAGAPAPLVTDAFRPGDVRAAFASTSRAEELLGYQAYTSQRSGLAGLLEFVGGQTT